MPLIEIINEVVEFAFCRLEHMLVEIELDPNP